jgi:hypothetical protein
VKESPSGIPDGHWRRSRLRIVYRSTFYIQFSCKRNCLASGGPISVRTEIGERSAKGCGLWKPWGARVGSCLYLERSQGSLLPASVSALQASPRTSECGSSQVPTARECDDSSLGQPKSLNSPFQGRQCLRAGRGKGASGTPPPTVFVSSVCCRGRRKRRPLRFLFRACVVGDGVLDVPLHNGLY